MTLYFKIHTTVYKTKKTICFHNNKDYKKSVEINFSEENLELLNRLFLKGVDKEELDNHSVYQELHNNGFLYSDDSFQKKKTIRRTELFLKLLI